MKDYGIGSDNQLWLQSGAHLITGLVAGNTKGAIASAAAPWLAKGVKQVTLIRSEDQCSSLFLTFAVDLRAFSEPLPST